MLINLKVKTLDAQTHEFSIDNEITVREFKDKVAEKTNIAADQQRIIYCGRVMVDDKQLKEYDVDGKVVHVAERPPPSQRLPATDSSSSNANPPNERRTRARPVNMRNSPLFRALDGMVVGTMAFPMNANANGQAAVNPFAASSSFCMNRITVARHMLECANNIAAYLEDPTRGLNNQSLDILARGRWTMESTVVEVGITSDIPQSQQIVEMVQGAVQAALRRSGNTNVTLVQLPTVYSTNENEANSAAAAALTAAAGASASATDAEAETTAAAEVDNASTAAAAVVIEDVIDEDEDTPTNEPSDNNSATASPSVAATAAIDNNDNAAAASNTEDGNDNSRRRTGTPVLAGVIEQMRNVQNRLNPFIEQYYDLLQNEPSFEEDDTTGRENAQRLFDRVSEAFHYMSHAQHAISDLMLDVSQGAPRYLTCRPILVEQSGYVSSNNFLTPAMIPAGLRQQQTRNTTNGNGNAAAAAATIAASTASTTTTNTSNNAAARSDSISGSSTSSGDANNSTVDDPIDDPVVWQPAINSVQFGTPPANDNTNTNASNNNATAAAAGRVPAQGGGGTLEIILQPSRAMYLERNFQRQVARLLQDVVSAAPFDTEFHVHINTPNIVSIDVPIGVSGSSSGGGGTQASQTANSTLNNNDNNATTTTSTATATTTTNDNTNTNTTTNSSSSSTANPARVTTATLPTTSTQTRSTSRPQVHFGNIPVLGMPTGWNGRVLPSNNVSSFDRFLPCNSHHIREPETASNAANDNGSNNAAAAPGPANRSNPAMANIVTRRPLLRTMNDIYQRMRPPSSRIVGSTMTSTPRSAANNSASASASAAASATASVRPPILPPFMVMRDLWAGFGGAAASSGNASSSATGAAGTGSNQDTQRLNIHSQLMNCLNNHIFEGQPINDDTIPPAINRAIQWFGESLLYLPQYEKPEYDSRDSLFNILRSTLPAVIELFKRNPVNLKDFEQKLKQICEQFRKRLYSVLYICIGRANAEIFWVQLMRLLCNSIQTNLQGDVVEFLALYLTPAIPSATDEADAQQFIVQRNAAADIANNVQMPMDTDVEMSEAATTSQPEVDDEPLPSVVSGSATWHRHFPNDWLPIITRDMQRQTDNPPDQPPFSDAYISGMSSKRRKLVQNSKPPTEIGALIADSVRKAIQNPGLGTSAASNQTHTPEDVSRAIASDAAVQSSCIDAVRTNVRERLKKDPDFEADKFPKSNKFIKK
ncbi:large proline-rich protein BAG6 isoform X2 [Calliphora vicina]|uniref:large proline-rich protein BAG6 isoform X2 n=1 Tax=Calliphora vicina TaxID=7373 RepID=UPI00325C1983